MPSFAGVTRSAGLMRLHEALMSIRRTRAFCRTLAAALLLAAIEAIAQTREQALRADINADMARGAEAVSSIPTLFEPEVRLAERIVAKIAAAARTRSDELSDAARAALAIAEKADVDRCSEVRYRAVIDPADKGDGDKAVYLLAEGPSDRLVIGRHFQVTISADGSTTKSTQASTVACLAIPSNRRRRPS